MLSLPLRFETGHLYVTLDGNEWMFDTGSPNSFGAADLVAFNGDEFKIPSAYMGMDAAELSNFAGQATHGLLAADVINHFDVLIDIQQQQLTLAKEEINFEGTVLKLDQFMGIPLLDAEIGGEAYRMFFDTGAQVSYFQHRSLSTFPAAGTLSDFYPGYGKFETDTHKVDAVIGGQSMTLRCGGLPKMLAAGLVMAGAKGIIGNEILPERVVGYFPRRKQLVLGV